MHNVSFCDKQDCIAMGVDKTHIVVFFDVLKQYYASII